MLVCLLYLTQYCYFQVWLFLADNYIKEIKIDWERTVKFAFNEKSNPDDNKLGLQIVKVNILGRKKNKTPGPSCSKRR